MNYYNKNINHKGSKKNANSILVSFSRLVFIIGSLIGYTIYSSYIFSLIYNMFIPVIFTQMPYINFIHSLGINVVIGYFRLGQTEETKRKIRNQAKNKKGSMSAYITKLLESVFSVTILLLIAYIISLFM